MKSGDPQTGVKVLEQSLQSLHQGVVSKKRYIAYSHSLIIIWIEPHSGQVTTPFHRSLWKMEGAFVAIELKLTFIG